MTNPIVVWFRQDLRLADNPALHAAAASGRPVLCLYIHDDETPERWRRGGASRWWLHHSLTALSAAIAKTGGALVLRQGRADRVLPALAAGTGAAAVYWNRCYEPFAVARDKALKEQLTARGIAVQSFNAAVLAEPWSVKTLSGGPFRVYTPFRRALSKLPIPAPLPAPAALIAPAEPQHSERVEDWALLPSAPDWAGGLRRTWTPGEAGALARFERFLSVAGGYAEGRDRPGIEATSRLSPHLHFGEISPRLLWHRTNFNPDGPASGGREKFLGELGWREFSYHLLFHNPQLPQTALQTRFTDFPWAEDQAALRAWQRGQTGIPIVDAGMRELWQTGWMHNRVRMIAASFLVKHLLIPWQAGEAWFWDTLVDADLANNAASWQWVAGCGADAAPYFRIFNPVLQGEKFDSDGAYVRRYVPELARLPGRLLHKPWEAGPLLLKEAGIVLGQTYPEPITGLAQGRDRALAAFARLKA